MSGILLFSQVVPGDITQVGNKAISLARLFQEGFNIPPGFIISANVFKKLTDAIDIRQNDNQTIQKLILSAEFPRDLKEEIFEAYESLSFDPDARDAGSFLKTKEEFVAVRSSYLTEDTQSHLSLLNIKGKERLLQAIKECYASLFREGTPSGGIAIIVQKMIDSKKSGILYTVNPETQEQEIIIKACFGLGEAIKSGKVFPDLYAISKEPLEIKAIKVQDKKVKFIRDIETHETVRVPLEEKGKSQVLTEREALDLALVSKKIIRFFGDEQQIEWAIKSGKIYILQVKALPASKPVEKPIERVELEIYDSDDEEIPQVIDIYEQTDIEDDLAALEELEEIQGGKMEKEDENPEEEIREFRFFKLEEPEEEKNEEELIEEDSEETIEEHPEEIEEETDDEIMEEENINNEPETQVRAENQEEDSIFSSYKGDLPEVSDKSKSDKEGYPSIQTMGGNFIVTCDMVITSQLKKTFIDNFEREPGSYHELLNELNNVRDIPYLAEIKKIRDARNHFLDEMKMPGPEDISLAATTTFKFLRESK